MLQLAPANSVDRRNTFLEVARSPAQVVAVRLTVDDPPIGIRSALIDAFARFGNLLSLNILKMYTQKK